MKMREVACDPAGPRGRPTRRGGSSSTLGSVSYLSGMFIVLTTQSKGSAPARPAGFQLFPGYGSLAHASSIKTVNELVAGPS